MGSIRRAAVFGGTGFIGRYLVRRLAQTGAVIAVVGRHADQAKFLQPMGDVGQIAPLKGSILDRSVVERAIEGADTVVSLAGILYERGRQRFDAVHRDGPALIAECAAKAGVERLLHVSALGADPASPSRYARSKAAGEAAVRAAFPESIILRPSVVFGPEDQFFNRFARFARLSPVLPVIGGGRSRFQPVYVGDVAEAAERTLERPEARGRIYELGGPRIYTFRELMELLLSEIDNSDDDAVLNRHALVSLPFPIAGFFGSFAQLLPNPPLTRDQVALLKRDNVVAPDALGLADLGIESTAPELILPSYLDRFRKGGWYSTRPMP